MNTFTTRDLALLAILASLLVGSSYIYLMNFVLVVMAISFRPRHIYPAVFVASILICILFGNLYYLVNLFFLPLIVLLTRLTYYLLFKQGNERLIHNAFFGSVIFSILLVMNTLNLVIYGLIFESVLASLASGILSAAILAFASGLFAGLFANKIKSLLKTKIDQYIE